MEHIHGVRRTVEAKPRGTYPRRWAICQTLVLLGSTTSVAGLALVTALLQGTAGAVPAWVGLLAVVPGVAFWDWHLVTRIANPQGFARGELLSWPFFAYSVLILAGLAAYGIAFWLEGSTPALGISLFASAAILLGLLYVFKDMPPFVHYLMILGISLVLFI